MQDKENAAMARHRPQVRVSAPRSGIGTDLGSAMRRWKTLSSSEREALAEISLRLAAGERIMATAAWS